MPASSLASMAQNAAIRNIASITDIAELPYHAVEPILRRIDNPTQLREIEVACPHIAEHSGALWQELIKRDVPNAERKMLYPKDPRSWWKVYRKMCKQEAADKLAAEENLKQAMLGLKEAKGNKETTFVPKVYALGPTKKVGFFDGVAHTPETRAPSIWNAKTGRDAVVAMQRASASKGKVFQAKTRHYVPAVKDQIKVAPRSMIVDNSGQEAVKRAAAEAKKYAEPTTSQRPRMFAAPLSSMSKAEQAFKNEEIKARFERENRLRQFTKPTARPAMYPSPSPVAQTAAPPKNLPSSSRSTAVPRRDPAPNPAAPAKRAREEVTFSPSPPRSSGAANSASQSSQPQKPTMVKRKRPTADPFLSTKRSRT